MFIWMYIYMDIDMIMSKSCDVPCPSLVVSHPKVAVMSLHSRDVTFHLKDISIPKEKVFFLKSMSLSYNPFTNQFLHKEID